MIEAVRLVNSRYADSAFDGEGARRYGGRWNSKGASMVYAASSLALAALEMLVHLGDTNLLEGLFVYITASFDEEDIITLDPALLPKNWRDDEDVTRALGDAWVAEETSLVFRVPSVVIPAESNYLINPTHPDAGKLILIAPQPFQFDPRLI